VIIIEENMFEQKLTFPIRLAPEERVSRKDAFLNGCISALTLHNPSEGWTKRRLCLITERYQ
jgi:hypothetical protein